MKATILRAFAITLAASGFTVASTAVVPVTGLVSALGQGIDPSSIFDNYNGELAAVAPDARGETADHWRALTAITVQADAHDLRFALAMGDEPDDLQPQQPLGEFLSDLKEDQLLALSNEQHGAVKELPGDLCILCLPGVEPTASETLADLAAEPFEPILYVAAAFPKTPAGSEPASSAPVTVAMADTASPGGVRLAAFLLPPDMPKRNATYYFVCGCLLLLAVRFRRFRRMQKSL